MWLLSRRCHRQDLNEWSRWLLLPIPSSISDYKHRPKRPLVIYQHHHFQNQKQLKILNRSAKDLVYKQTQLAEYYATPDFSTRLVGYSDIEIQKLKRIYDWMLAPKDLNDLITNRQDFYRFFNEHDKRRGTNFVETFPEMEDFYNQCKELC